MKKVLISIVCFAFLLLVTTSAIAMSKTNDTLSDLKYKVAHIGKASKADKELTNRIMEEVNNGKTPDEVFADLGFKVTGKTTYLFQVTLEEDGQWKKQER